MNRIVLQTPFMIDSRSYWFNFRTQEYDLRECPADFTDYISQHPAAQALYWLYQEVHGDSPIEAAMRVLKISAGMKEKVENERSRD